MAKKKILYVDDDPAEGYVDAHYSGWAAQQQQKLIGILGRKYEVHKAHDIHSLQIDALLGQGFEGLITNIPYVRGRQRDFHHVIRRQSLERGLERVSKIRKKYPQLALVIYDGVSPSELDTKTLHELKAAFVIKDEMQKDARNIVDALQAHFNGSDVQS